LKLTKPLIPEQLRLDSFDAELRLSHNGELYANPGATAHLDSTAQSHTDSLLFDQLSDTEVALHWVARGTNGSSRVRRPKKGNTALFSGTPLLLLFPKLRVPAGRIRRIPYRIDAKREGPLFVLDLTNEESIPSSRRPQKSPPETNS
jgi:hypothetical protein